MGRQPELEIRPCEFRLIDGETLLAVDEGLCLDGVASWEVGQALQRATANAERSPLAKLYQQWSQQPLRHQRGGLAISRV